MAQIAYQRGPTDRMQSHGCTGVTMVVEPVFADRYRVLEVSGCSCWQTGCDSQLASWGQLQGQIVRQALLDDFATMLVEPDLQ